LLQNKKDPLAEFIAVKQFFSNLKFNELKYYEKHHQKFMLTKDNKYLYGHQKYLDFLNYISIILYAQGADFFESDILQHDIDKILATVLST